jgi:hypothetical protein
MAMTNHSLHKGCSPLIKRACPLVGGMTRELNPDHLSRLVRPLNIPPSVTAFNTGFLLSLFCNAKEIGMIPPSGTHVKRKLTISNPKNKFRVRFKANRPASIYLFVHLN